MPTGIYKTPAGKGCYRIRADGQGPCPRCGTELVFREMQGVWVCPRRTRDPLWQMRKNAAGRIRFESEALEWFAAKIGIDVSDERLPEIAVRLASAGKLLVMVNPKSGALVAIAKAGE